MAMTLRTRLTVTAAGATMIAAGLLVLGLQLLMAHQSTADSVRILHSRLAAGATTIRFSAHGPRVVEVPSRALDQGLWIYDRNGQRIDGSAPAPVLDPTVSALAAQARSDERTVQTGDGSYRVAARPVEQPGSERAGAVVVAAIDLSVYERNEARGLELSVLLGIAIVAAAATASWVSAGSSLRRVGKMARLADDWGAHDPSRRFALGPPGDELTELGRTLDHMLARIGQALLAERRLTDEVAHELRTPLASVRAEAELALSDPNDQATTTDALRAVIAGCDRMTASIKTMLAVARNSGASVEHSRIDKTLHDALRHLPNTLIQVIVEPIAGDWAVAAPADVVGAAVAPVIDNALRHARSRVDVWVRRRDGSIDVIIEDDGAGIQPNSHRRIFEPGWTDHPDGTGLGLPLARRMARTAGGDIAAVPGPHGKFVITLPEH